MQVIEQVVADQPQPGPDLAGAHRRRPGLLPDSTAAALKEAVEASRDCTTGAHVTLAVGYGGRQEVIDALRALLHEQARRAPPSTNWPRP